MKNIIPVIVAVILGLAGVWAVNRVLKKQTIPPEKKVLICAASRPLKTNEIITEESIFPKEVSYNSLPQQHIIYGNKNVIIGQRVKADISKNDYILLSHVGTSSSMSNVIGEGEWGCPVTFSDATLLNVIQQGDEIAIVAIFPYKKVVKKEKDANAKPEIVTKQVATVLYPRVRVLKKSSANSVIISMPPQQALALTSIQQRAALYPLLRKTNDSKGLNRKDGGLFDLSDEDALEKLTEGMQKVEIPSVPTDMRNER